MRAARLTATERRVLEYAARGLGVKETAVELSRSVHTVKQHRSQAMRKLEARTMPHAISIAIGLGILEKGGRGECVR